MNRVQGSFVKFGAVFFPRTQENIRNMYRISENQPPVVKAYSVTNLSFISALKIKLGDPSLDMRASEFFPNIWPNIGPDAQNGELITGRIPDSQIREALAKESFTGLQTIPDEKIKIKR